MSGFLMVDIQGTTLSAEEAKLLCHPAIWGVILFGRNYSSKAQLQQLVLQLKRVREPRLLIAVDQEGGQVQRFRSEFTKLPSMRLLGKSYDRDAQYALELCKLTGWLMASELMAVGVDFSFAPVLDLDRGVSTVIGDRSFHRDPASVIALASAVAQGMQVAGMQAVGKHFPGHGGVSTDSHLDIAKDSRSYEQLLAEDIQPFASLINHHLLAGIMPAHVIYPAVDDNAAGFSSHWLKTVLRQQLGFQGTIFSDDLTMEGAKVAGDIVGRARAAIDAGCDKLLVCNHPDQVALLLDHAPELQDKLPVDNQLSWFGNTNPPSAEDMFLRSYAIERIEELFNEYACAD